MNLTHLDVLALALALPELILATIVLTLLFFKGNQMSTQISPAAQVIIDDLKKANTQLAAIVAASGSGSDQNATDLAAISDAAAPLLSAIAAAAPAAPATITVSPTTISGPVGTPISGAFSASGGTAPYTYAVATNSSDFTVNAEGNYSSPATAAESGSFTVTATDADGNTGEATVSYSIS